VEILPLEQKGVQMITKRKRYDAAFKAKVALEAIKSDRTIAEIASEYGVHPNQITKWKRQVLEELPKIFSGNREKTDREAQELISQLYQQIGQLKVELEWLKKKLVFSVDEKRQLIEHEHSQIPVVRQCELVGLARSTLYYSPHGDESYNEELMRLIDEQYTRTPFYGIRRMTAWLRGQGHMVNGKRVARLMALMGLEAIYPKGRTNLSTPGHRIYP
jgi:putative transposase